MKSRTVWIGKWLIATAIVHALVGVALGGDILIGIVKRGMFNTVPDTDPLTGMVVWFMLFSAPFAMLGMAVDTLERAERFPRAFALGLGTAFMALLGVVLMPVSGFWVVFPPAIGLMLRSKASAP